MPHAAGEIGLSLGTESFGQYLSFDTGRDTAGLRSGWTQGSLFTTNEPTPPTAVAARLESFTDAPLADLIDELAMQDHGLIMCRAREASARTPSPRPLPSRSPAGATSCT